VAFMGWLTVGEVEPLYNDSEESVHCSLLILAPCLKLKYCRQKNKLNAHTHI
jgi:hypothetical protein